MTINSKHLIQQSRSGIVANSPTHATPIFGSIRWLLGYGSCGCSGDLDLPAWLFILIEVAIVGWFLSSAARRSNVFAGWLQLKNRWIQWSPEKRGRLAGVGLFAGLIFGLQLPVATPMRAMVFGEPAIRAVVKYEGELRLAQHSFGLTASLSSDDVDSAASIEQGDRFLKSRIDDWRSFGNRPRWYQVVSHGGKTLWHTQPGFEILKQLGEDGVENVRVCNDRYSASIQKRPDESAYRIIYIDDPYDVQVRNRRLFDALSYTLDKQGYIPDMIESGAVRVSGFEIEGETTKVWLRYVDEFRAKNLTSAMSKGNIQLTFGNVPYPIGLEFETGSEGEICQVHRMKSRVFKEVNGELLATVTETATEIFRPGHKGRTMSFPASEGSFITNAELDRNQCYLGYYGLDEPAFAKKPTVGRWTIVIPALVFLMLFFGIWRFRKGSAKGH